MVTERNDFVKFCKVAVKPGLSEGARGLLVGSIYGFVLGILIGWLFL